MAGMNQSEHSTAELTDLLKGKNTNLREFAAYELGRSTDPQAVEILIEALGNEKEDLIKWAIVQALGQLRDSRAFEPLKQILRGETNDLQSPAVYALAEIRDPRIFELFLEVLQDKQADAELKSATAHALGALGDSRAVEPLLALLHDNDLEVQAGAIESLGMLGDTRAYEPLVALLHDKDGEVLIAAVHALGNLGDDRAIEPVTALLNSDDYDIREVAAQTLDRLSGSSFGGGLLEDDVYDLHAILEEKPLEKHSNIIVEAIGYEQPPTPEVVQKLLYLLLISHDWDTTNHFVEPVSQLLQEAKEVAVPLLQELSKSPVASRSATADRLLASLE